MATELLRWWLSTSVNNIDVAEIPISNFEGCASVHALTGSGKIVSPDTLIRFGNNGHFDIGHYDACYFEIGHYGRSYTENFSHWLNGYFGRTTAILIKDNGHFGNYFQNW